MAIQTSVVPSAQPIVGKPTFVAAAAAPMPLAPPTPNSSVLPSTETPVKMETSGEQPAAVGFMNNTAGDMMITLNRLNTQESEVDVEGLSSDVKLEYETVVTTTPAEEEVVTV